MNGKNSNTKILLSIDHNNNNKGNCASSRQSENHNSELEYIHRTISLRSNQERVVAMDLMTERVRKKVDMCLVAKIRNFILIESKRICTITVIILRISCDWGQALLLHLIN